MSVPVTVLGMGLSCCFTRWSGNDVPNHGGQTWVAAPLSIMMLSSVAGGCPIWLMDKSVAM